ncbi:DUF2799 domain-containing protein [Pseudoduganella sp. UC29_106]|uniref:DUF2799 domain-containing protein n=1 Tax=Pseudoduganella sp. UC29_106 TaxID=3374553 RepID=UPI0037578824
MRLVPLLLTLTLTLAGCQSTMQRIADCKTGDWRAIGQKDGAAGEKAAFAERKDFCDDHTAPAADAPARYADGWTAGNADFWSSRGNSDGRNALQLSAGWESRAASEEVRKKGTPPSRAAYEAGWTQGNSAHWEDLGRKDGTSGQPLTAREGARSQAAAANIRYDDSAYGAGWQAGNRTFWEDAGYSDARSGVPDSEFKARAAKARAAGVQVQEDVYRTAWNAELINYWRKLGTQDATSGKEFGVRKREAQQRGLKVLERDYIDAWERRLADYWRQAGEQDGFGQPYQLEARVANASRDGVFVIHNSRALYKEAWTARNAQYCTPANAFEWGRTSQPMAIEVCQPPLQGMLQRAYLNGGEYTQVRIRYERANDRADDFQRRVRDERRRMERAERDIRAERERKDKPPSDETIRRLEAERRDAEGDMRRAERERDEARRSADRHYREMDALRLP